MNDWWTFDTKPSPEPRADGDDWPPAFDDSDWVDIDGVSYPFRRLAHHRARSLRVIVDPVEGILVRARRRPGLPTAKATLRELATWLELQVRRIGAQRRTPLLRPEPGTPMRWSGSLRLVRVTHGTRGSVEIDDEEVHIIAPTAQPKDLMRVLEAYGRPTARRRLTAAIEAWSPQIGVTPKRLRVGDMKTRWASCSSSGTLSFTWRIMALSDRELDYLVVHELMHLRHPDHSERFWRDVLSVIPDARAIDRQLDSLGRLG